MDWNGDGQNGERPGNGRGTTAYRTFMMVIGTISAAGIIGTVVTFRGMEADLLKVRTQYEDQIPDLRARITTLENKVDTETRALWKELYRGGGDNPRK